VQEIRKQPELGSSVEQIEPKIEVGRHPISMRFDIDMKVHLFIEPLPAIKQRHYM
jgi:acid phosphatase class B